MAMKGVRKIWNSTKRLGIFTHSLTKHKKGWEAIKILDKHRDAGMFARLQERWRCFFTPWPQNIGMFWGYLCDLHSHFPGRIFPVLAEQRMK